MPDHSANPLTALVAALLGLGFIVLVALLPGLNTNPFIQGVTGIVLAAAVAVVLFSAVPSKASIKGLVSLGGAAAFFFVILPQIQPFIFPFYSFSGYVAYEGTSSSEKGFEPVEGVEVEIKGTGLKTKTDGAGSFTIPNVPGQIQVNDLIINRGGESYSIEIKKNPNKIFRIPKAKSVIKSAVFPLAIENWSQAENHECGSTIKTKHGRATQFLLTENVHNDSTYSDLIVRVWSEDDSIEIIKARKLKPANGYKVHDDYQRAQQWQWPIEGNVTQVSLAVCVGATKDNVVLSRSVLNGAYWFEKVE